MYRRNCLFQSFHISWIFNCDLPTVRERVRLIYDIMVILCAQKWNSLRHTFVVISSAMLCYAFILNPLCNKHSSKAENDFERKEIRETEREKREKEEASKIITMHITAAWHFDDRVTLTPLNLHTVLENKVLSFC